MYIQPATKLTADRLRQLAADGLTISQIARRIGCSTSLVRRKAGKLSVIIKKFTETQQLCIFCSEPFHPATAAQVYCEKHITRRNRKGNQ